MTTIGEKLGKGGIESLPGTIFDDIMGNPDIGGLSVISRVYREPGFLFKYFGSYLVDLSCYACRDEFKRGISLNSLLDHDVVESPATFERTFEAA